ncbi:glycoside hydrolase family 172 protein [Terracidiphilus gabretensis]|uniref:glycoside hydrolase family 172 protein n=1 Tax=Terracidiphilus gabretensis TaxID=1577687 RepID=UPI000AA961C9|nr:glycoside hydrolase family 172 protein [Terracidiphilus gabretensis]
MTRMRDFALLGVLLALPASTLAQTTQYDGLTTSLSNIYRTSDAHTYSISPENLTGEKGKGGIATEGTGRSAARDLGQGWKISPSINVNAGQTITLADIDGSGQVQHIWMTPTGNWRLSIFRIYWDGETEPSVEVPVGDFFAMGWNKYAPISSLAICVNPGSSFNSYWPMPFRKKARITLENLDDKPMVIYYQIDYTKAAVPADAAYFHAQFRRVNPVPYKQVYTILDGVEGKGQYVGTYLALGTHNNGWWGEGEIKFYMDGDTQFPTINGTGTEDYFNGSYDFENPVTHQYDTFTSPYSGLAQVIKPDGLYESQQRFGMYRWHIPDPIRFDHDLHVTIQDLGWQSAGRYLPLMDDISSVAYWYQTEPHKPFPKLPARDLLQPN